MLPPKTMFNARFPAPQPSQARVPSAPKRDSTAVKSRDHLPRVGTPDAHGMTTIIERTVVNTLVRANRRLDLHLSAEQIQELTRELARMFLRVPYAPQGSRAVGELTYTEKRVLIGVARGHTTAEISKRISSSENTIKTQLRRVYTKLGARRMSDAIARAFIAGELTAADIIDSEE